MKNKSIIKKIIVLSAVVVLLVATGIIASFAGDNTTYFVDSIMGLDTNDGTTQLTAFKTINYAINTVPTGSTVKLLADDYYTNVTGTVISFPADKEITLDLDGHKISGNASTAANNGMISIGQSANAIIKNGTLEFVGCTTGMLHTIVANGSKAVLDGLTIKDTENYNAAYVVCLYGSKGTTGEYEVKNCKFEVTQNTFAYAIPIFVNNSKYALIEDNEFDITACEGESDPVYVGNTSLVKIKDSYKYTINSTGVKRSLHVNNSTLDLTELDNTIVFTNPYLYDVKVEGDINTCLSDTEGYYRRALLKNEPTLNNLPTGVEVYSNTVSETKTEYPYVLGTPIFVTTSGTKMDNKYETIEDCLADIGTAKSGVKMLGDYRGKFAVADGCDLELDLNGFKLFYELGGNDDAIIISVEEGAKFLLKDSSEDKTGTVSCEFKSSTTAKAIALRSAGEAIVERGILLCIGGASNYSVDVVGTGSALIKGGKFPCLLACAEDATLKVEGGSFANDPKDYIDTTKSMVINNTGATVYFFSVAEKKIINPTTGDNSMSTLTFLIVLAVAATFTTATLYVVKRKEI